MNAAAVAADAAVHLEHDMVGNVHGIRSMVALVDLSFCTFFFFLEKKTTKTERVVDQSVSATWIRRPFL